ncbi:MAG: hypothetical protein KBI47_10530 [Armatimonadetes bacterium]|nr:hypothetical protein [Armatimonadota bacterium]MDI9583591.1 hypothetical protein [Acidobacteriota bacterium]
MTSAQAVPADWTPDVVAGVAARICPHEQIQSILDAGRDADAETVRDVLHRAMAMEGLTPEDVGVLIQVGNGSLREEVLATARRVHEQTFNRRVALSTPICPTNRCINDCLYCPLRRSDVRLRRTSSTIRDLQREITGLLREGHRHFNLVFSEDRSGAHHIHDMLVAAYGTRSGVEEACRVDLNVNPMQPVDFRLLTQEGYLGTYHCYQETYHRETYERLHVDGPKADYHWRITGHDRAIQGGVKELGLGVLLGAYDFRYDVVALIAHCAYLKRECGYGAVSITLPRMVPAKEAPASQDTTRQVDDEDLKLIVAVCRLARPHVAIVMCTPAERETRRDLYALGISEVSVGSLSYPGAYTADGDPEAAGRLTIGRPRALEVLIYRLCDAGFVPYIGSADSLKRYRVTLPRRPGEELTTPERRSANSLLALREYLMDYASPDTARLGEAIIQRELVRLPADLRDMTLKLMEEAEAGLRGQMF